MEHRYTPIDEAFDILKKEARIVAKEFTKELKEEKMLKDIYQSKESYV